MAAVDELVGRDDERRLLEQVVWRASDGSPAGAIVVGEAGIGKSALVRWMADLAHGVELTLLFGRALPLTFERALFPFLDALDVDHAADEIGAGRRLVEAGLGDPAHLLAQRIVDDLDDRATHAPVMVVLEDLHWADRPTLTLVHHLLTRGRGGVSVVATARHHRSTPGENALDDLFVALPDHVLPLGPLDEAAVDALAARRFGRPPGRRLTRLLGSAGGNPLLIDALLSSLAADDAVSLDGPQADLIGAFAPSPTSEIERRVLALPARVRRVVQVAAVLSPYLRVDAAGQLADCRTMEVLAAFETAIEAGVLSVDGDRVGFRHELYREAALGTLPETARDALHLEAARVLSGLGASGLHVAEHYALGARPGNREAIAQLTAVAAEVVGADPAVALRLTDVAVELGAPNDLGLRCTRVRALAGCGRAAEAELLGRALLREPLDRAVEAQLRRELALAAVVEGRTGDAAAAMRRVLELAPDESSVARGRAELAFAQMLALQADDAHRSATEAAAAGRAAGDVITEVAANSVLCWLDLWRIDFEAARLDAERLVELTRGGSNGEWLVYQPGLGAAAALFEIDDLAGAQQVLADGRRAVVEAGLAWATPAYDALDANLAMRAADPARVRQTAFRALEGTHLVDGFGVEVWSRALLARVALFVGDVDAADEHLVAADLAIASGRAQFGLDHLALAQSALAEHTGDLVAAHRVLTDSWDLLGAIGIVHAREMLVGALARTSGLAGDHERLEVMQHAVAAITGLSPSFVADLRRIELWITPSAAAARAAIAAARSAERPLELIGTLLDVAELATRAETMAAEGTAAQREVRELLTARDMVSDGRVLVDQRTGARRDAPRRVSAKRPRFGIEALTESEARVAALVAEGLTNVEIAARLLVSRRTIDTHVLAAYRKLEVRSRVELTRAVLGI